MTDPRLAAILDALHDIAAGQVERQLPLSPAHDEIDAVGHIVNVVGGELRYTTERLAQARDDAERANQAKSVFLRNVSHELRTPLSAIVGIAELLATSDPSAADHQALTHRLLANSRALLGLVDDLLDLSKVESDKLVLELAPLDVASAIADVVDGLEPTARAKELTIAVQAGEHAIEADAKRVRQILVNLIGNAIKFTDAGCITVSAIRRERMIEIDVSDTGIGVAQTEHLFEPFAQGEPAIAVRYGGTGLGLALSRRLARAMRGDVVIVEALPSATFRLSLPAIDAAAPLPAPPMPLSQRAELAELAVLVVDDHEDVRRPIAMLLEGRGARVVEASGGREAIDLASKTRFDVIVMDVRMPDVDGLAATRKLRALGNTTPIIAMTADVLVDRGAEYREAGCSAHTAKPVDVDRLVALLHALRN